VFAHSRLLRLESKQARYNLTQSRPFFRPPLARQPALPSKTLYFFHIVKERLQTSLPEGPAKKPEANPLSLASAFSVSPATFKLVELIGIEPTTPCLQSRCSPS
jgi:hypothetical protein